MLAKRDDAIEVVQLLNRIPHMRSTGSFHLLFQL